MWNVVEIFAAVNLLLIGVMTWRAKKRRFILRMDKREDSRSLSVSIALFLKHHIVCMNIISFLFCGLYNFRGIKTILSKSLTITPSLPYMFTHFFFCFIFFLLRYHTLTMILYCREKMTNYYDGYDDWLSNSNYYEVNSRWLTKHRDKFRAKKVK